MLITCHKRAKNQMLDHLSDSFISLLKQKDLL